MSTDPVVDEVSAEIDFDAQVPRMASYKHAHPDAYIFYLGTWWQYLLIEHNGMTGIIRSTLRELLDHLESLDADGTTDVSGG